MSDLMTDDLLQYYRRVAESGSGIYPEDVQGLLRHIDTLRAENERLESDAKALREALNAFQIRVSFIGHPNEPRQADGSPDWSKEIALAQTSLEGGSDDE